jgi:hypothetical protein
MALLKYAITEEVNNMDYLGAMRISAGLSAQQARMNNIKSC